MEVQLLSTIGQGSYGTVYRPVWRGSLVAAKVIQLGTNRTVIRELEKNR